MTDRSPSRDVAAMVGGLALGVVASRLFPPLLAAASGSVRARLGQDPFEPLIEDHRYILNVLHDMEYASEASVAHRGKLFLMLKRRLAKHALAEEDVVYPLLYDQAERQQESKQLYDEHADMKILLFQLEGLLKSGGDWSGTVRELRTLIQKHVREEEDVEFPALRRTLDARRNRKMSGQIRREEALVL